MTDNKLDMLEEDGIDLIEILHIFWIYKYIIIAFMMICALGMFAKTIYFTDDTYTSSGILYVSNKKDVYSNEEAIQKSDIDTSRSLSTTYIEILKTVNFLDEVSKDVGKYTWSNISQMTSISSVNETELLKITVTAKNGEDAYRIAESIFDKAPDKLTSVYKSGEVEVVDPPRIPASPNSKGTARNTAVGAVIGIVAGVCIILIRNFFDTKVHKSEDAAKRYNVSILGEIRE